MADAQPGAAMPGMKFTFSTDTLPDDLSQKQRLDKAFGEALGPQRWGCEILPADNRNLAVEHTICFFGDSGYLQVNANVRGWHRTAQHIAQDRRDTYQIGFNLSGPPVCVTQRGRETIHEPGHTSLITSAEPVDVRADHGLSLTTLSIAGDRLRERLFCPDDLTLRLLNQDGPAFRYLQSYMQFLMAADEPAGDPMLAAQIDDTLVDLVALALGATRDSAALARARGVRQARLCEILALIRADHTSPAFSLGIVSAKLGLSSRYIQELLQETGTGFTERVQELRLQRALSLLSNSRFHHMKIIDIALASGFGDVSYFNRCFRRRFGLTPRQARAGRRQV